MVVLWASGKVPAWAFWVPIVGGSTPPMSNLSINAPREAETARGGTSSGRSRKNGASRPAVIFALAPEESKGENDLPRLPNRMQEIWKDSHLWGCSLPVFCLVQFLPNAES